jgi:hypothetical protein
MVSIRKIGKPSTNISSRLSGQTSLVPSFNNLRCFLCGVKDLEEPSGEVLDFSLELEDLAEEWGIGRYQGCSNMKERVCARGTRFQSQEIEGGKAR